MKKCNDVNTNSEYPKVEPGDTVTISGEEYIVALLAHTELGQNVLINLTTGHPWATGYRMFDMASPKDVKKVDLCFKECD